MKKIIALLLALVMALGLLAGCGDKANTGDNSTMTMWTMSAVMALAGAAVLVLRSRKEKYEG